MIDHVTAEEAQSWLELAPSSSVKWVERLAATVVHQAELLAEAQEALQTVSFGKVDEVLGLTEFPRRGSRRYLRSVARAALARPDSQEADDA